MKKFTKILALVTALNMLVGLIPMVSYAAADPTENAVISYYSGKTGQRQLTLAAREVTDFGDRENVVHYNYTKGAQMAHAVYLPEDQAVKATPNRKLSFDFLLHNNTIPYELRLLSTSSKMIGECQFNFYGAAAPIPDGTTKGSFRGVTEAGKALATGRAVEISNDEWHTCEAIMDESGTSFYVDGAYVDRTALSDVVNEDGLIGVQIVQRATNQSASVDSADGIYFDNIKTYKYDENSQFYGTASYDGEYTVTVDFSESINSSFADGFTLGNTELINTQTGASISLENVVKASQTQIVINSFFELETGVEYMVKLPNGLKGISGKKIYSDVYFTPAEKADLNSVQVNDDFSSYAEKISSVQGNIVTCAPAQLASEYVTFKDIGGDHGKVLSVNRRKANNNRIRFGVAGKKNIDVSKGAATIEFDIRVLDNAGFKYFAIQPYSVTKDGVSDKSELTRAQWLQADGAFLGANRTMDTYNSQMCTLFILTPSSVSGTSQEGNTIIQSRYQSDNGLVIDNRPNNITSPAAGNNVNMNVGTDWHHIKLTISHTGTRPITTYQLDDGAVYTSTIAGGTYGNDATDLLCGVRICEVPSDAEDDLKTSMVQFDNFKISGPVSPSATVKKIRMYNPDGEEYGPLSNEISPSADKVKVFFTDSVDISNAAFSVTEGVDTLDCEIGEYNSRENSVTITINEALLKSTKYTVNVEGVKAGDGSAVADASAEFTTTDKGEFLISDLRFTDGSGNTITNTIGLSEGDTVYTAVTLINTLSTSQNAVVLGASYSSNEMKTMNYKEYVIPANSKVEVISDIPVKVSSLNDLNLGAMIWESFDTVKPLCDAVILAK